MHGKSFYALTFDRASVRASRMQESKSVGYRGACFQCLQEGATLVTQLLFERVRAIAFGTGPRFRSILVSAIPSRMRVLHLEQFKVFLPIGTFFIERSVAETHFNPARRVISCQSCLLHVMQVFVASDGAATKYAGPNRLKQRWRAIRFDARLYQVPHCVR